MNFQMFKLVLEKAEEPEIKLPTSAGSWKKEESSRKASISALLTMPKPLTDREMKQFVYSRTAGVERILSGSRAHPLLQYQWVVGD